MLRKQFVLAVSSLAMLGTASQTVAGGRAVECYEPYRTPPVYDTVYENVEVHPGYRHVEKTPPIYGTRKRAVLVQAESVGYRTIPAQYGYEKEMVLVEPARKVARVVPAVTRTVYDKVRVSDGGYRWEWQWIDGRKVLCKVKVKAHYKKVARTVVVQDAYTVYEKVPAQYAYQKRKVLIVPERTETYVIPAKYDYVLEQVVVQPGSKRVIDVPPSYRTVARDVLVSEGSEGWRQVRIPRHCKY